MRTPQFRWKEKKCLVTGAFGFVGTHLCRNLLRRGAQVTALDWRPDVRGTFLGTTGLEKHLRIVRADVRRSRELTCLRGTEFDCVFHLAAQPISTLSNLEPEETIEINALGATNVGRALSPQCVPPRFVFASSACWYGATTKSPLSEADPYVEGEFAYSESKVRGEESVLEVDASLDIPTIRCRFVNLYGPGDRHFSRIVPKTIRHLLRGEQPCLTRNDGTTVLDYLYVGDAVIGLVRGAEVAQTYRGQVFNFGVGGDHPVSARQLVGEISEQFDGTTREPLLRNPVAPMTKRKYLDISKAVERLAWRPTRTLKEGLRPTIEWYRKNLDQVEHLEF